MMISDAALSDCARVRRLTISLPLAPGALVEPPMRGTVGSGSALPPNENAQIGARNWNLWMRQPHERHADAEDDWSSATADHSDFRAI